MEIHKVLYRLHRWRSPSSCSWLSIRDSSPLLSLINRTYELTMNGRVDNKFSFLLKVDLGCKYVDCINNKFYSI
jgi:hypothetical protein